jgi:GMP synthase (glutamine-hydrolysing)
MTSMTKTLLAIRHVSFEDLGSFEAPLTESGYTIRYCDMGLDELPASLPDMLVVLGAPIGAYEDDIYPFLKSENALIAAQLKAEKPLLGICLGAQMIARAMGARVYPGRAKEIGWKPLTLTEAGETLLAPLKDLPMLHWHGDTFDLPDGAINLASTPDCDHQAFTYGNQVLAFQFHPEVREKGFERWLIGHAAEISANKGASVPELRAATRLYAPAAEEKGSAVLAKWLDQLS